jgi:predicted RNA-binding Zn-ribbon protein involved in translation (DUF1610 family)
MIDEQTTVVQTDLGAKDGQTKCPKCGSTEITLSEKTGMLRCEFCHFEFPAEKVAGLDGDIHELTGEVVGSGALNIVADTGEEVTFKCSSCGAEVVVNTVEATGAKCHWCRNVLSVNQQVPNGAVPDVVLPFKFAKADAKNSIAAFVKKRGAFAHPKFKAEFTTDNTMGVYLPYLLVDANASARFSGQGEHLVRQYTRRSGNNIITYYDADLYNVSRDFDILIDDLTIESSKDKLNKNILVNTNNVINAIMPFDTAGAVKWDANYLKGYTSEKRDTDIDELRGIVETQTKDVARNGISPYLTSYDRGVRWNNEQLVLKGQQWKAAYLPVWLYSYLQISGNKKLIHYVAVNARSGKTMGSVPISRGKLAGVSALIEVPGALVGIWLLAHSNSNLFTLLGIACCLSGFVFFITMFLRYRNVNKRFQYEKETKTQIENVVSKDDLVEHRTGLRSASMNGANGGGVGSNRAIGTITSAVKTSLGASDVANIAGMFGLGKK